MSCQTVPLGQPVEYGSVGFIEAPEALSQIVSPGAELVGPVDVLKYEFGIAGPGCDDPVGPPTYIA